MFLNPEIGTLLVSQMSYSELWKPGSAICVVCDVPYQLIFELLAGKVIESCKAFLLTADCTVNQSDKMKPLRDILLFHVVMLTLLEHVIHLVT